MTQQHAAQSVGSKQQSAVSADTLAGGEGALLSPANLAPLAQRTPKLFPTLLKPHNVHYLQRTIGNRAVSTLLGRATPADRQSDATIGAQGGAVDGATAQAIQRATSGGLGVPAPVAAAVQGQTGVDVRHARIHTGKHADVLNRKLNAEAFTRGRDIFFAKDAYKPVTSSGKRLLAHELAHVAQQTATDSNRIQPKLRSGTPALSSATGNGLVQRRLTMKPDDLDGEVSKRGKFAGKLGFESTFSKVQRYLTAYWDAGKNIQMQLSLLTKMKALVDQWLKRFNRKSDIDANQGLKSMSLYRLKQEIDVELPKVKDKVGSENFMKEFALTSDTVRQYRFIPAQDTDMAVGKKIHQLEKNNLPLPESSSDLKVSDGMGGEKGVFTPKTQWGNLRDKYRNEKPLGLTPADRAALGMYTGEQFIWMNPAMADNKDWFQATTNKQLPEGDARKNDKKWQAGAMEANKKAGGQLVAALNKLPNWEQTKTIYRGETVTEAEALQFKVGSVKTFNFFVSTSQETITPLSMIRQFTSEARPWGVMYYIKSSKSGKDVRPWSANAGEAEILFAPNSKFTVTKVLMRDDQNKRLDLEVVQS